MGAPCRTVLVLILAGALAVACVTVPRGPGERLHLSKCGACHQRPARGGYTVAEWREILEGHRKRFPLTGAEIVELSAFLASEREPG